MKVFKNLLTKSQNLSTGNKKDRGNKQQLYYLVLKHVLNIYITNLWLVNVE